MLKFVPDCYKTKKMWKHAVKKLPFLIRYVPDQYKYQQMCDILESVGTLKSVPDHYKNHEMCNEAVDDYPHALEFVPVCYKTHKICDKAVDTHPSSIQFVPECYKTQEKSYKAGNAFNVYNMELSKRFAAKIWYSSKLFANI